MAIISNPETFSTYYNVDEAILEELGIFDPTLAADTRLFIDPLLLQYSEHPEIHGRAYDDYRQRFSLVITLLSASQAMEDVAWRGARRLLRFHEIRGTCLGYGAGSIRGSGFGTQLTERILIVAKEIVDLGIQDPDLFPALSLFESNIGSDRISDMTTNVILPALTEFNQRILEQIELFGMAREFLVPNGSGRFLPNPFDERTPLILVPSDILRILPIAMDWDEIAAAASQTEALRNRVNEHIGHIFAQKTKRSSWMLKHQVLANTFAFETFLNTVHAVPPTAYEVGLDPDGRIRWARLGKKIAETFPLDLTEVDADTSLERAHRIVGKIINHFRFLIEKRGLWVELYNSKGKPRHERSAQNIFFSAASSYCKANNLDISPESHTGTGQVDFKISEGFNARVLVEIKLSSNTRCVQGYQNQLGVYRESEETMKAWYLVVDVGKMGYKQEKLIEIRNRMRKEGNPISELEFVDGLPKDSASKG